MTHPRLSIIRRRACQVRRRQGKRFVPGAGVEPACRNNPARDFKSLVSTSFTTRARVARLCQKETGSAVSGPVGGGGRNRTGVHGFAGRCMTTLPPRRMLETRNRDGLRKPAVPLRILERERSLELPTLTLARLRSTN